MSVSELFVPLPTWEDFAEKALTLSCMTQITEVINLSYLEKQT
ncbi:hypothetical protein [Candidatus Bathycorpusculum sp.]